MPLLRITNGFDRMPGDKLLTRANQILSGLTGNINYPTPSPSLASLQTAITEYTIVRADIRSTADERKAKRLVLVDLLHLLGYYVLFTAQGSLEVAGSSNFSLAKPGETVIIETPRNMKVVNDKNPGALITSVMAVKGAMSYVHQYTTDATLAEDSWVNVTCTMSKCTITGLTQGTKYYCRVVAIGSNEQATYGPVEWGIAH